MIILTAQPDELYYAWQSRAQMQNFKEFGIDMSTVHIVVGYRQDKVITEDWLKIKEDYGCNVHLYVDGRTSTHYLSSIRPFLLHQFLTEFPKFENEYTFYIDSDVIFTKEIEFEGMMDGRWHISRQHYASYDYVASKKSPSLARDMLGFVGIDVETALRSDLNMGGIQYFIPNHTASFWKTIEHQTELMHSQYWLRIDVYKREVYQYRYLPQCFEEKRTPKEYHDWVVDTDNIRDRYDFQVWCTDLFCISWELAKRAIPVYANPMLNFAWPMNDISDASKVSLFHNSGVNPPDAAKWFHKQDYKAQVPFFDQSIANKGYITFDNGYRTAGCQRLYIELLMRVGNILRGAAYPEPITIEKHIELREQTGMLIFGEEPPKPAYVKGMVSCIMTTYGRHTLVERSIAWWLLQDYPNKELVIFNTADTPLTLSPQLEGKGIRVYNNPIDFVTSKPYDNVGAVRRDASKMAFGEWYICWDDDDLYLPWHITQGIEYLKAHPDQKAYMPMYSYYTPDGGKTIEYAKNSMEASCIVSIESINSFGFYNSNGAEHLSWRQGLVQQGLLNEKYDVRPFESYMYIWGEEISPRKQSGYINDPNNFENHKLANTDFGDRPLTYYPIDKIDKWYRLIAEFADKDDLWMRLEPYINTHNK